MLKLRLGNFKSFLNVGNQLIINIFSEKLITPNIIINVKKHHYDRTKHYAF